MVNHRSDVMRQIKSMLLFHGIEVPFSSRQQWTPAVSYRGFTSSIVAMSISIHQPFYNR
jgi:small-conductance mechanosensitive channel